MLKGYHHFVFIFILVSEGKIGQMIIRWIIVINQIELLRFSYHLSNLASYITINKYNNPQLHFLYWQVKNYLVQIIKEKLIQGKIYKISMNMLNEALISQENQNPQFPKALLNNLYVGHFLSRWSARLLYIMHFIF